MLKNIKKVGIFVVFPMIIALATYAQAFQELANFFEGMTHLIDKEYLLNKIFLFPDYNQFEYLGGRSIFQLMPPYFFWVGCMIVSAESYLTRSKKYIQFMAARKTTSFQLYQDIQKQSLVSSILFSFVFHLTIAILIVCGNNLATELGIVSILQSISILFVTHTLLIIGMMRVIFYIYLKKNEVVFVLTSAIVVGLLMMINLVVPQLSIIFLWYDQFWIPSTVLAIILLLIAYILQKRIKFDF
jgi:hypothetical protein